MENNYLTGYVYGKSLPGSIGEYRLQSIARQYAYKIPFLKHSDFKATEQGVIDGYVNRNRLPSTEEYPALIENAITQLYKYSDFVTDEHVRQYMELVDGIQHFDYPAFTDSFRERNKILARNYDENIVVKDIAFHRVEDSADCRYESDTIDTIEGVPIILAIEHYSRLDTWLSNICLVTTIPSTGTQKWEGFFRGGYSFDTPEDAVEYGLEKVKNKDKDEHLKSEVQRLIRNLAGMEG